MNRRSSMDGFMCFLKCHPNAKRFEATVLSTHRRYLASLILPGNVDAIKAALTTSTKTNAVLHHPHRRLNQKALPLV